MSAISARPYICDLHPYQPGLPVEHVAREYGIPPDRIIKLASNENPLGCSPYARMAIEQAVHDTHRYPEQYELVHALAAHYKIGSSQVVIGNGSNDVLDLIARAYLGQGDEAIVSRYAFAIYQLATQSVGGRAVIVPDRHYGHDLEAMLTAITPKTRLIWLANPNNPTGTFVPYETIRACLERVPENILVVLDEAYYEYLKLGDQEDSVQWIGEYPNLVLVRTFSKIYGLAGLRVGYGLAAAPIIDMLNRVRQPFNGSILAMAAAIASLQDQAFVQRSYAANATCRAQLLEGLSRLGLQCLPAYGNFITFRVAQAAAVNQALLAQGVIVRPLAA